MTIYSYFRLGWGGGETAQANSGMEHPTACTYLESCASSTQDGGRVQVCKEDL
jgi:hypothetical protein